MKVYAVYGPGFGDKQNRPPLLLHPYDATALALRRAGSRATITYDGQERKMYINGDGGQLWVVEEWTVLE